MSVDGLCNIHCRLFCHLWSSPFNPRYERNLPNGYRIFERETRFLLSLSVDFLTGVSGSSFTNGTHRPTLNERCLRKYLTDRPVNKAASNSLRQYSSGIADSSVITGERAAGLAARVLYVAKSRRKIALRIIVNNFIFIFYSTALCLKYAATNL